MASLPPPSLPPPTSVPSRPPAGWYPDPWAVAPWRWWDGTAWTGHLGGGEHGQGPGTEPTLPVTAGLRGLALMAGIYLVLLPLLAGLTSALDLGDLALVTVALVGLYLPMTWWCFHASRQYGTGSARDDLGLRWRWVDLAWALAALFGVWFLQAAIALGLDALGVPIGSNTEGIEDLRDDTVVFVALGIAAVVIAPFVEELFFRGLLLRSLRSRLAVWPAVLTQAVVFAVFHLDPTLGWGNVSLLLILATVGAVFGLVTRRAGRLGPAMLAHAAYNGTAFLVLALDLAPS